MCELETEIEVDMKEFFIYYWSGQDPDLAVQAYEDRVRQVAEELDCSLIVRRVDVPGASQEDKKHWSGNCTIECVSVDDGQAKERTACSPAVGALNPLVRNLCL